ncbi:hypothetical protein XPA_001720 [Xanthoria parietina]
MENLFKDQSSIGAGVFYEKQKAYLGSIKYPLSYLEEESAAVNPRQTDPKNIQRLLNIFRLEGCCRLEPRNRVPVLISEPQYERLINQLPDKGVQLRDCNVEPPETTWAEKLVCLHGKHRLEAARHYLGSGQKWWIIDLYRDDIAASAKAALREEHENTGSFLDGDVYRHIRLKQLQNDVEGKRKWLAKLSAAKRRDVLQLEKRAYVDYPIRGFNKSLDRLVESLQQVATSASLKPSSPPAAIVPNGRSHDPSDNFGLSSAGSPTLTVHDPQTALVPYLPYQDTANFNTSKHSLEETFQIAKEWYEAGSQDRLIVAQETDQLFAIHRLDFSDDDNFARICQSLSAIYVPDGQKRFKSVRLEMVSANKLIRSATRIKRVLPIEEYRKSLEPVVYRESR